jgi:hypothetical protein
LPTNRKKLTPRAIAIRAALAERRAAGVQLGRTRRIPEEVAVLCRELYAGGMSLSQVAAELTARGIPTAEGGPWQPSVISRLIRRPPVES